MQRLPACTLEHLRTLLTECVYVFRMIIKEKRDYFLLLRPYYITPQGCQET